MSAAIDGLPLVATPGFSTLGCGELEFEQVLTLAVRRGIAAVELRTLGGHNRLPEYFDKRYGTPERLGNAIKGVPVQFASLDSSCNAIGTTAEHRAELVALAPWAEALGARAIRVFDGGERGDAAELAAMGPLFTWWGERGAAAELIVETHDALARPEALLAFLELYPRINVLWDTYHTWKEGGAAPASTWPLLRYRTRHLHLKDSVAAGYVIPGRGEFPFAELFGALCRDRFAGVISLEWERHWYPELAPIEDALDGFTEVLSREAGLAP